MSIEVMKEPNLHKLTVKILRAMDGKDTEAVESFVGEILYEEVKKSKPEIIVEVGTGNGYSTTWMLLGVNENEHGRIITFDRQPRPQLWHQFYAQTPRIEKVLGEMHSHYDQVPEKIDMIFLDGDHQIHKIIRDFDLLEPRLSHEGSIFIHDISYLPKMGQCVKSFFKGEDTDLMKEIGIKPSPLKWDYKEIEKGCGLAIVKRGKK